MEYRIKRDENQILLAGKVERLLKEGWKLQGGVSCAESWQPEDQPCNSTHSTLFAQALVK